MTIKDVYEKYQIMPQLATHMLRVAGVGKLILDGWKGEIDHDLVIRTLLLHDMGNIVKFNLTEAGQQKLKSAEPVDLPHWRKVQQEFWNKYGRDTHKVTKKIVRELEQNSVNEVMDQEHIIYFSNDRRKILEQSSAAQILLYADTRVTPFGVTTLEERIADLCRRYSQPIENFGYMYELEKAIQVMTAADLVAITEEAVTPFFDEWLTYTI